MNHLAQQVDAQHRRFFWLTGWLMVGGGLLFLATGAKFVREGNPQ